MYSEVRMDLEHGWRFMNGTLWDHFRKFVFPVAIWGWGRVKWHFHCIQENYSTCFPRRTSSPLVARHWEAVTIIGVLPGIDPKAAPILLSNCTSNNIVLGLLPKISPAPQEDYTLMNTHQKGKSGLMLYMALQFANLGRSYFWTSSGYFCSGAHWRWFCLGLLFVFFVLLCFVLWEV